VHSCVHEERAATFASGAGRGALYSWICVRSAQPAGAAGRGGCGCRRCWGHIAGQLTRAAASPPESCAVTPHAIIYNCGVRMAGNRGTAVLLLDGAGLQAGPHACKLGVSCTLLLVGAITFTLAVNPRLIIAQQLG
jgi:hypothetical protein